MDKKERKEKKPIFKRPLTWIIIIAILIIGIASSSGGNEDTNTNANTENTPTQTEAKTEEAKKEEPKKLSIQEAYDKLSNGMSKDEAEAVVGKDSGSCSVTEDPYIGKMESCTYAGGLFDGGMIMITYDNGKLYNKTISKY